MNPESVQNLITQFTPLLAEVLTKKPPQPNLICMKGSRFIAFLQACPEDVKLLANAIEPDETYLFGIDAMRELANPLKKDVTWPSASV